MVFQSYALYPHMTVAQNIGFPLKMVGMKPAEIASAVAERGQGQHRPPAGAQARPALGRPAAALWRWPAPSCASPACSCWTSRSPTSTPSSAWRPGSSCSATALARHHHGLRHARPGRGDDARRPHRRLHGRTHRRRSARRARSSPRHRRMAVAGFIGTPPMNLLRLVGEGRRRGRRPRVQVAATAGGARRDARRPASDLRIAPAACPRASSASRTWATARSSACRRRAPAQAEERPAPRARKAAPSVTFAPRPRTCSTPRPARASPDAERLPIRNDRHGRQKTRTSVLSF